MSGEIKPRFQVRKLRGKGTRRIASPKTNEDGKLLGGFEFEDREVDAGWNVYFPSGSSIHIWTQEEMERQGFLETPDMVNMETGDNMGKQVIHDYEAKAEQKSNRSRSSRVAQT
jgi:hypothetical protein